MGSELRNSYDLKFSLEMITEFNKICKEQDLQYWFDFETLQSIIDNKSDALMLPVKISMVRKDFNRLQKCFLDEKYQDYYCILSTRKNNLTLEIHNKNYPDDGYIDIIPYDYICIDTDNITESNNKIINYRRTLKNIIAENGLTNKFYSYLFSYQDNILKNKQEVQNSLIVGLEYECSQEESFRKVNEIFPLKNQLIRQVNCYIPHFAAYKTGN